MELIKRVCFILATLAIFCVSSAGATLPREKKTVDLLEIYHLALKNDMTLATAHATLKANLENTPIARSTLLPQLSMTATSAWNKQVNKLSFTENQIKNNGDDRTFGWNGHGWGATLSQSVLNMSNWFSLQAAKAQNRQDFLVYKIAQQDLIMRVASTYFDVLHLTDILATTRAERRAVKSQLRQAKERYEAGLLARGDVEEAKASYDSVAVKVIEAENNVNLSYKKLATITALPVRNLASLMTELKFAKPSPAKPEAWVKQAIKNNLDMKSATAGINTSEYNLKASRAARLPSLDANISFVHDTSNTQRKLSKSDKMVYGVTLTLPLFTGGNVSSTIAQNRFLLESAEYTAELQKRTVSEETLSFYDSVSADLAKVNATCQDVVSARSASRVTESGYHAGIRTIMDVLQSQQNLYSALQSYFGSRYSYILDTLKLKKAAGILSPADLAELNQMLRKNNSHFDPAEIIPKCDFLGIK